MEYKAWYNHRTNELELLIFPKKEVKLIVYAADKPIYRGTVSRGGWRIDLLVDSSQLSIEVDGPAPQESGRGGEGRRSIISCCYGRSPMVHLKGVGEVMVGAYQFVADRVMAELIGELSVI